MSQQFELNGDDWLLTGWYPHQWRAEVSMELGVNLTPAVHSIKAVVPGSVQTDLLAAGWLKDPNIGLSSLEGEWVNNREWVFEKFFELPQGWTEDRCEITFEGLDYAGEIYLNGMNIAKFEGMFKPVSIDVTEKLIAAAGNKNHLKVVFLQTPEVDGQIGYSHQISKLKSRFNYAWDWCPRIIPVGIWRDVYLSTYHALQITDFYPAASLLPDYKSGMLELNIQMNVQVTGQYHIEFVVLDEENKLISSCHLEEYLQGGRRKLQIKQEVEDVKLWWPNGYGAQPLYTVKIIITDSNERLCQQAVKQVGFRHIEFIQNENAPTDALPYTLLINGLRIFIKGVNWVPITPFYGAVTEKQYEDYLGRFKVMNVNLLRVWGGGIIEKQAFYEYCDRHGLLVWQEFLQSSSGIDNNPPDDPTFLQSLREIATIAILEKRAHPSLTVWCGGNELMWSGFIPVNETHVNIAMLKGLVNELDPSRYFLPASASGPSFCAVEADFGKGLHHDVHGPWVYLGDGQHYGFFNQDDALLRSETGSPGIARLELLEKYKDRYSVWPPNKTNPYWTHRGSWWIQWEEMKAWFGQWEEAKNEMDAYMQCSRYLQHESLRYAVESTRRREPQSSGFIVWMGNEPYANNANTSLIEVDGMPKPAYYSMQKAFSKLLITAQYEQIAFQNGELFRAAIYLHHEQEQVFSENEADKGFKVRAVIYNAYGECLEEKHFTIPNLQTVLLVGELEWKVSSCPFDLFILRLEVAGDSEVVCARNSYIFTMNGLHSFEPLRSLKKVNLELNQGAENNQVIISNPNSVAAIGIFIRECDPGAFFHWDQNYITLLPNEAQTLSCLNHAVLPSQLVIEGVNLAVY
ncbi:hypothetical protein EHS13_27235 [Paenibacillus psychroresistens]|uniref:beta-mannosidase n=1 Tax=Paenibacillus psychroresistens TaxID=1778678 RepID=A0A6B8RR71_9BACL|nr:glycoside hydrolase family 2 TIM barrel-domain containing protein [Paenibacillus psychroresistens]QGQ98314.1 hypothetical protein EHS13_27235 [Paenibacillus psychroresistens]